METQIKSYTRETFEIKFLNDMKRDFRGVLNDIKAEIVEEVWMTLKQKFRR